MDKDKGIAKILSNLYAPLIRRFKDRLGSLLVKGYTNSSTLVRTVEDEDLEKVLEIYKESFDDANPNQVIKYSKLFRRTFFVYEFNDAIVGYVGFYVHLKREGLRLIPVATAYSIAVGQKMRSMGICTMMYNESISQLRKNNVRSIYAYINANNKASLAAHQKLGFVPIKVIENLYGVDAGYKVELRL
jgi:ribosomal-protein-alanine N-acetyltransferase